jgi:hypothetical protein
MRLEATISETRHEQLRALQAELKLSKSQVVGEALSIFLKAYMETKRGNRLAIVEPETQRTVCEVASPSLSQARVGIFPAQPEACSGCRQESPSDGREPGGADASTSQGDGPTAEDRLTELLCVPPRPTRMPHANIAASRDGSA